MLLVVRRARHVCDTVLRPYPHRPLLKCLANRCKKKNGGENCYFCVDSLGRGEGGGVDTMSGFGHHSPGGDPYVCVACLRSKCFVVLLIAESILTELRACLRLWNHQIND